MRTKTKELREFIIEKKKEKVTNIKISEFLNKSIRCVKATLRLYNNANSIENKYKNCGRKSAVECDKMKKVITEIKEQPDITLRELITTFELGISQSTLCRKLKKLGYTLKKRLLLQENN